MGLSLCIDISAWVVICCVVVFFRFFYSHLQSCDNMGATGNFWHFWARRDLYHQSMLNVKDQYKFVFLLRLTDWIKSMYVEGRARQPNCPSFLESIISLPPSLSLSLTLVHRSLPLMLSSILSTSPSNEHILLPNRMFPEWTIGQWRK